MSNDPSPAADGNGKSVSENGTDRLARLSAAKRSGPAAKTEKTAGRRGRKPIFTSEQMRVLQRVVNEAVAAAMRSAARGVAENKDKTARKKPRARA